MRARAGRFDVDAELLRAGIVKAITEHDGMLTTLRLADHVADAMGIERPHDAEWWDRRVQAAATRIAEGDAGQTIVKAPRGETLPGGGTDRRWARYYTRARWDHDAAAAQERRDADLAVRVRWDLAEQALARHGLHLTEHRGIRLPDAEWLTELLTAVGALLDVAQHSPGAWSYEERREVAARLDRLRAARRSV